MSGLTLVTAVVVYGFAAWLGLYLIGRDPRDARLRLTGMGLVAYALAVASHLLVETAGADGAGVLGRVRWPLLHLPAVCWTGVLIHLLPEEGSVGVRLARWWKIGAGLVVAGLLAAGFGTDLAAGGKGETPNDVARVVLGVVVMVPMLAMVGLVGRAARGARARGGVGPSVVVTLFFGLSLGLLLFPFGWVAPVWALCLVGVDLIGLGVALARFDAFDQGEALLPDMLRSFDAAFLAAVLFGGQVALVMALAAGRTVPLLALLLGTVAAAVAVPVFADPVASVLDRLALGWLPKLRATRAELRATASALPRAAPALDPATLDEAEFARLTRRALSHFGDLPRLSASPLTRLPLVERRLAARGAPGGALERAAELKSVLAESIDRLKPRTGAAFGTADEWRYYNALYFPYVVGLKPYRRRAAGGHADGSGREALEWFRTNVPERTLHNWQTAAAKLVALDLRGHDGGEAPVRRARPERPLVASGRRSTIE